MSVALAPSGRTATQAFQVENSSEEMVPLEIFVTAREMGLDGEENIRRKSEVAKQFLVYPPQLMLKPFEKRTIRVTWVGSAELKEESAFRLVAEQLPVKSPKAKSLPNRASINVLMKYVAALYVTPSGAKSKIELKDASLLGNEKPQLNLLFENVGTEHQLLTGLSLRVTPVSGAGASPVGKASVTLGPQDLASVEGQNILAKKTRRFRIPWPSSVPRGPVRVDFEIKQ